MLEQIESLIKPVKLQVGRKMVKFCVSSLDSIFLRFSVVLSFSYHSPDYPLMSRETRNSSITAKAMFKTEETSVRRWSRAHRKIKFEKC